MPRYFLGVDIGGTKSNALIADEAGRAVGFGTGGAGNPEVVGYGGLARVLREITAQALSRAGLTVDRIAGAGFGIAGYDWPSQRATTLSAIEPLGVSAPMEVVNDTIIGLLAGSVEGWGIALVSGTGCNCRGWDRQRREGRALGIGEWMGEAAGAGELVEKAVQAVGREWTRRGPPTRLTPAFIGLTGARDIEDLIEGATTGRYWLTAEAAPLVFRVAAEGDPVARGIIEWAGRELGEMAAGVIRQLGFEALEFEVVLVGSMHNRSPLLMERLRETVHAVAPGARFVPLTAPPVIGGVLLGMEQAGMQPVDLRETLNRTTCELTQC